MGVHISAKFANDQKTYQNVFRIAGGRGEKRTTKVETAEVRHARNTAFRPRKSHRKSRTGCRTCKARRIRCDESRDHDGGCLKCKSHGVECDYTDSPVYDEKEVVAEVMLVQAKSVPSSTSVTSTTSPASTKGPLVSAMRHSPSLSLSVLSNSPKLPVDSPSFEGALSTSAILHHFASITASTCGSPASQNVQQTKVVAAALQTPFLMHALLGMAAAHLRYLTPRSLSSRRSQIKLIECSHWAQALEGFRDELAGPKETRALATTCQSNVSPANMDQLFSTVMFVSMHQFELRDYYSDETNPADRSFVWVEDRQERDIALKWLGIEAGFRGLLQVMAPWLSQSFWLPIMRTVQVDDEVDLRSRLVSAHDEGRDANLDETELLLVDICGLRQDPHKECPYLSNLETLIWCRSMQPVGPEHFNNLIAFVGRCTPEFRQLLIDRDTPALLILLHWLALMLQIGQWWISGRCQAEITAIAQYLLHRDVLRGQDSRVRQILQGPAASVGLEISVS